MKYKGYTAIVEFDEATKVFSGQVAGLEGAIMFQSESSEELENEFRDSVEFYLEMCAKHGVEAERPNGPGLKYRAHQMVDKVFA
jgi:predicted HicB family RNase H-like nuclease